MITVIDLSVSTVTELYLYFFWSCFSDQYKHHVIEYRVWDGIIQPYLSVIQYAQVFGPNLAQTRLAKYPLLEALICKEVANVH